MNSFIFFQYFLEIFQFLPIFFLRNFQLFSGKKIRLFNLQPKNIGRRDATTACSAASGPSDAVTTSKAAGPGAAARPGSRPPQRSRRRIPGTHAAAPRSYYAATRRDRGGGELYKKSKSRSPSPTRKVTVNLVYYDR